MIGTAERFVTRHQDLSAPNRAVGAIAGAVEGQPYDWLVDWQTVFGHTRCDVGMVVLDTQSRDAFAFGTLQRVACAQIIGMKVVSDNLWLHPE